MLMIVDFGNEKLLILWDGPLFNTVWKMLVLVRIYFINMVK